MELLEFARGPGLALSIIVFVLGLAWRLYRIFRRPARIDYSEPRRRDLAAGGLRAIFTKMLPPKGVRIRGAQMANAYAYHIALALIAFGFAPHIAFIARYLGLAWPALPDAVTYIATTVAILGLIYALMTRLTDGVQRLLSSFDDYFSWAVTMAPLVTGMALLPQPAPPAWIALHLLSLELLLLWLPFGKLAHAALVFVSRFIEGKSQGNAASRRRQLVLRRRGGVVTLHRADEHRRRAFQIKMKQVEAAGAERLATSCSNCRLTFDDGQAHYKWDRKMESLLELVADHLA